MEGGRERQAERETERGRERQRIGKKLYFQKKPLKCFKYGASVCKYYSKIISYTTYVTTFLNCM